MAARRAAADDRQALEEVCRGLADPLYRLALRMLSDPDDAADATQDVMVLIITNLSSFRGHGMLLCLTRTQRAAYLLGDVLGVTHTAGAQALGCTPAAFRQVWTWLQAAVPTLLS